MDVKYWFSFREKPDGNGIACGPYNNADTANVERIKMTTRDTEVGPWFVAESKDEAFKLAEKQFS